MKSLIEHFRRPPWPALLGAAAAGHAIWLLGWIGFLPAALCASAGGLWAGGAELWAAAAATLALNSPGSLLNGWTIMLAAMMPPLLAAPILHVRQSSLSRRKARAVAAFVTGYMAVWLAMAVPVGLVALFALTTFGPSALPLSLAAAFAWSASPAHRKLLNRGHRVRPLSLFGLRADRDCLSFGLEHGVLCAGTCFAWMVVPLLAGEWHYPAMFSTGLVLLAERLSLPRPPRWRWPRAVAMVLQLRAFVVPRATAARHG